jgi:hypothetical protein
MQLEHPPEQQRNMTLLVLVLVPGFIGLAFSELYLYQSINKRLTLAKVCSSSGVRVDTKEEVRWS